MENIIANMIIYHLGLPAKLCMSTLLTIQPPLLDIMMAGATSELQNGRRPL
jgi:hypothetical protein